MASANPLNLFAAQSLDRAAPELASLFQEETGTEVIVKLGHSGFLRTEIEAAFSKKQPSIHGLSAIPSKFAFIT